MIFASSETRIELQGWTAGYCHHCDSVEPMRIESIFRVTKLLLVFSSRRETGQQCICHFCSRETELPDEVHVVAASDWSPDEDVMNLVAIVSPALEKEIDEQASDHQIGNLLDSVQEATSAGMLHVDHGLMLGGLFGAILCPFLAWIALTSGWLGTGLDEVGWIMLAVLGGGLLGSVVGAVYTLRVSSRKAAYSRLKQAADIKPAFDLFRVEQLSRQRAGRVRDAAMKLYIERVGGQ
jgi:hypothetical protein